MKSQGLFLKKMLSIPRLARGRIGVMSQKTKSGTTFHNLQYTKNRKHFVKYIPASQLAAYKEATENYRRFMDLVNEYIDMMSERAAKEIEKEERDAEGKDGHGKV